MVVIRPVSNKLKQCWLVHGIHSDVWKLVALKRALEDKFIFSFAVVLGFIF